MSKTRFIVLHSFNDERYQDRLKRIADNRALDGIAFRHCCVIDRDRGSARVAELDQWADQGISEQMKPLVQEDLKQIIKFEVSLLLDKGIGEFRPDVVIIQGGTIFDAVPGPCMSMIIELQEKYPGLPFALQGKIAWLTSRTGRDYDPFERRWAINQIRWARANFIEDDEVEEIIQAVFD